MKTEECMLNSGVCVRVCLEIEAFCFVSRAEVLLPMLLRCGSLSSSASFRYTVSENGHVVQVLFLSLGLC